jgi:hypothetical protein
MQLLEFGGPALNVGPWPRGSSSLIVPLSIFSVLEVLKAADCGSEAGDEASQPRR